MASGHGEHGGLGVGAATGVTEGGGQVAAGRLTGGLVGDGLAGAGVGQDGGDQDAARGQGEEGLSTKMELRLL